MSPKAAKHPSPTLAKPSRLRAKLSVLAVAACAALPVQAITVAWDHAGNGAWAVTTNWTPVGQPVAGDDVFISLASASPYTVSVSPYFGQVLYQAASLKLTQPNATLSVTYSPGVSGVELALSDTLAVAAGTLRVGGAVGKVGWVHADNGMTFAADAQVTTVGIARLGGDIANSGTMDMNGGGYMDGTGTFQNQGLVTIGAMGRSVYTAIGHTTLNGGRFEVTAPVSGTGRATIASFTNLEGGTVHVQGDAMLALTNPDLINRGTVELTDDGAGIAPLVAGNTGRVVNETGGSIDLQAGSGGVRRIATTLLNAGLVEVGANLALGGTGAAHINTGRIHLANDAVVTLTGASFTNAASGVIDGNGTLDGHLLPLFEDHGTLSPGNSFGRIDLLGNYTQATDGLLEMEIGATGQDLIVVGSGTATFNGTLRLLFVDGFTPGQDDSFELISGSVVANFSNLEVLGLGAGYTFDWTGGTGLTLTTTAVPAVPEPRTLALWLAGLGLLGWRTHRGLSASAPSPSAG